MHVLCQSGVMQDADELHVVNSNLAHNVRRAPIVSGSRVTLFTVEARGRRDHPGLFGFMAGVATTITPLT